MTKKIRFIDDVPVRQKHVLLRVDFNVSMLDRWTVSDDARIRQSLPTLELLLKNKNRVVIVTHFDRPKKRDPKFSLKPICNHLQEFFPTYKVVLINDFLQESDKKKVHDQKLNEIVVLENIRFYPGEKAKRVEFSKKLAELADVYVNDAFGVSHRADASIVTVPTLLPSYGGLLMKKEIQMMDKITKNPKKPICVIIGGAKMSTKINFIKRLIDIADNIIVGGGIANTFLKAQGINVAESLYDYDEVERARRLLYRARTKGTKIVVPDDVVLGHRENTKDRGVVKKVEDIEDNDGAILDIGPESQAKYGSIIAAARTIVWSGPVGYFENPTFRQGTDFIYYAITNNEKATTIVGGGDTLAAISKKEYLEKITHLSTGGGAMLEFIEKGTLPGIEALKK